MSAHDCKELTDGCYRCELNRDEMEAAWIEYRNRETFWAFYPDEARRATRRLRKREFIAGFMAGRGWS